MHKYIDSICSICLGLIVYIYDLRTDNLRLDNQLEDSPLEKTISASQHSLDACNLFISDWAP